MQIDVYNVAGFFGAFGVICNYAYMQWKRNYVRTLGYSVINACAAALMCISLMQHFNIASFLINSFWCVISFYGIYRCLKYKNAHPKPE